MDWMCFLSVRVGVVVVGIDCDSMSRMNYMGRYMYFVVLSPRSH